jgi:hypothetical protein
MKTWKVLFAFFVLSAMAISPYMRSLSDNFVYWMGFFVYLFAGILTFVEGRYFERFWALGFFSLSLYYAITLYTSPLTSSLCWERFLTYGRRDIEPIRF